MEIYLVSYFSYIVTIMKANLNFKFEESPEQRKATASEEWKAVQCLCQCLGRGLSIMPDSESGWPLPFKLPPKRRGHGASVNNNIFFLGAQWQSLLQKNLRLARCHHDDS